MWWCFPGAAILRTWGAELCRAGIDKCNPPPHNRRIFFQPVSNLMGTSGGLSGHLRAQKTDCPTVVTDTPGSGLTVSALFSKHLSPLDSMEISAMSSQHPQARLGNTWILCPDATHDAHGDSWVPFVPRNGICSLLFLS